MAEKSRDLLKLDALDEDDLGIISAHLQDAVGRIGDMAYLPQEQNFALVLNRFDWNSASKGRTEGYRRRRAGLQIARVLSARSRNMRQGNGDAVVELLAIGFEPGETPAGHINLIFAGGGAVRLEVECIEVRLSDLGAEWTTTSLPHHDLDAAVLSTGD